MVIIGLSGGLGNQMFQYALYCKFKNLNKEVALDTSFFRSKQKLREIEIGIFPIKYCEISDKQADEIRGYSYYDSFFEKIINKVKHKVYPPNFLIYEDKIEYFQPEIFDMDQVYLSGYWQNEKYFSDIENEIRTIFSFPLDMDSDNKEILSRLKQENSISVHMRRGDYLSEKNQNVYGGICTERYYEKAFAYMNKHIKKPHYFLFTDDVEWASENIRYPNMTIVSNNKGRKSYIDMYLMSQCKHNIIANSSFSWWGAWLNQNEKKIVVAPKRWFNNHENADITCEGWITI